MFVNVKGVNWIDFLLLKLAVNYKSVRIRSYSVRMRENADQINSEYGHISLGASYYSIAGSFQILISCYK